MDVLYATNSTAGAITISQDGDVLPDKPQTPAQYVEPGVQAGVTMTPAALAIQVRTLSKQLAHIVGAAPVSSTYEEDNEEEDEEYHLDASNPYDPDTGSYWADVQTYFDRAREASDLARVLTKPTNGRSPSVIREELSQAIKLRRSVDGQRLLAELTGLYAKIYEAQRRALQYGFDYSEQPVRNLIALFQAHHKEINPQIKGLAESIYKYAQGLPTIENPPMGMEGNFVRSIVALAKIYYGVDLDKGVEALPDVIGELIEAMKAQKGTSQVMEVEDGKS